MVGWRADEAHARGTVAGACNISLHLGAWELTTLAWLGALRDFDLQLVRIPVPSTTRI